MPWDVILHIMMDAWSVTILIGLVTMSNRIVSIPMYVSSASRQRVENLTVIRAK